MPDRRRSRRSKALVVVAPLALTALLGGGWAAANAFESPAQREAAAKAPTPSVITAAVEKGDLARTITSSVTLAPEQQVSAELASREGQVVTGTPTVPGTSLVAGGIALETNGRPLIALPGAFPFYRDLRRGDRGPDVRQLQQGLVAAGIDVEPDGEFGKGTERAARALYEKTGYSMPEEPQEAKKSADQPPAAGAPGTPTVCPSAEPDSAAPPRQGAPETVLVVPSAELLVVPALPAAVVSTPNVGARVTAESTIALEAGVLKASTNIAPNIAAMMRPGTAVELAGPDGRQLEAAVQLIRPGAAAEDESTVAFEGPSIPDEWRGQRTTATITLSVSATDTLIVPSTAIVADGPSRQYVLRQRPGGGYERVTVRETAALEGRSAVEVKRGGHLRAGDRVRVK